jgi:exoribonuclease R
MELVSSIYQNSKTQNLIYYKNRKTNFCDYDEYIAEQLLYSIDPNNLLHLDIIPGILKLSNKSFSTTKSPGYIMKEFESAFNFFPTFLVKTNKIKDIVDKYVIVRIIHNIDNMTGRKYLTGVIEQYIGDVGDIMVEKELCKIMCTSHWSKKIDRIIKTDITNKTLESLGIQSIDLTPNRKLLCNLENILTLSVDPDGSKDIDDALSIQTLDDSHVIIGIHIADPSSYLMEGSAIDIEIARRSESIYLTNQTFHMFPEYLSTNVFSLNDSDKSISSARAFSIMVEMEFDTHMKQWKIISKEITKTLIRVDKNMSYDQFQSEYNSNEKMTLIYEIGKSLYKNIIDKHNVIPYDSKKMIEIFMVIANNTVAEQMVDICSTNPELSDYPILIRSQKSSQYIIDDSLIDTKDSNRYLIDEHLKLHMNQAELKYYCKLSDSSHSSLGLSLYTHFTSPIRRYSDICVHRIMWNLLNYKDISCHKFDLKNIQKSNLHQIFVMNHYKKFYKHVYGLEKQLQIVHYYIESIGQNPMNRISNLRGIVMDIEYQNSIESAVHTNHIYKLKIKCSGFVKSDDDISQHEIIDHMFQNMIHTITLNTEISDIKINLFDEIEYKACYLIRDVRKIRFYL